MRGFPGLGAWAVVILIAIFAGVARAETVNPRLVGGWLATTLIEGKPHAHWLELRGDGTWRRVEDYFGFRAENHGRWLPEGEGAVLVDLDVRLHLREGKLRLVSGGETLYAFEPCAMMPRQLDELPAFPVTLSETVAILSAELPEHERTIIAGTLAQDLPRFHHGLGTYIRNRFGLWGPNPGLLAACKVQHPDAASAVILRALRDHLRSTRPGGRELDQLEARLARLRISPLAVRQMTLAQFLAALNQETKRALRREGLLEDAVVFALVPPKDEEEKHLREQRWLNHPPGLRAWGQGDRTRAGIEPTELLIAFKTWLVAPGLVMLEPSFDPHWFQPPAASPDFASARWRDDWFEIESALGPDGARTDAWAMVGDLPPMAPEQAASYARLVRERIPAGKLPVEITMAGAPMPDSWQWSYQVRSLIDAGKDEHLTSFRDQASTPVLDASVTVTGDDLVHKSEWPDTRKPPRLSPGQALARFRLALAQSLELLQAPVQIRLKRAGHSRCWYYEVALGDGDDAVTGYVTLDGRVMAPQPADLANRGR